MARGRGSGKSEYNSGSGPMRRSHRESRNRRGGDSFGKNVPRHQDGRDEEKPCRTLFVRNLKFDTLEEELWSIFQPYGDIKEIFNKISSRGIAFVHYYDLRSAERAMEGSAHLQINGRDADIHYSLPKDDTRTVKCDATKNQGTLLLSLNQSQSSLVDEELYELFQRFGDVKVIRTPNFKTYSENTARWQRLLEFYDSRAAVEAANATHGKIYKHGRWDVQFFWDQGPRSGGSAGRDVSPTRRGTRLKQPDNRNYHNDPRQRNDRFSPPTSYAPSQEMVPYNTNYASTAPMDTSHMDNSQKAQRLLSLLSQLQSIQISQNAQLQSSSTNVPPPPPQQTQGRDQIQQLIGLLTQSGNQQHIQPPAAQSQPQPQPRSQAQPVYAPYAQTDYQQSTSYQPYQQTMQPQYHMPQQESQQQYQQSQQQYQQSQQQYQQSQQQYQQPQQQYQQPQQPQQQYVQYSPSTYSLAHPPYNP